MIPISLRLIECLPLLMLRLNLPLRDDWPRGRSSQTKSWATRLRVRRRAPQRLGGGRDPRGRVPFAEPVDWDAIGVHKVSGITHCLKEGSEARSFFCGRFKSDRYIKFLEAGPAAEDPDFCLQCCKARDG